MSRRKSATAVRQTVVIDNTQPRAITLAGVKPFKSVMLLPGQNTVEVEHWKALSRNPAVRKWVACGYLSNLGEGVAEPTPSGFDGMTDQDVKDRLGAISDPGALIELRDLTTSPALVRMANDRIRELTEAAGEDANDSAE